MGAAIKKTSEVGPAPKLKVRSSKGEEGGEITLDPAIFAIRPNVPVMHQVVTAQLAARRAGTQNTKTRAEVAGGGSKPWRQKGTGRARAGSSNSPIFSGGGVAHGPKPRSYVQKTPKKMVQLALRSALSDRAAEGKVVVMESFGIDAPSTRDALRLLESCNVDGKVLVVLGDDDENVYLSFRNVPRVQVISFAELNTFDVLRNDYVVFTQATLPGRRPEPVSVPSPSRAKASKQVETKSPSSESPAEESQGAVE